MRYIPLGLFLALVILGLIIGAGQQELRLWTGARSVKTQQLNLAMELARSGEADALLGPANDPAGRKNREIIARLQRLDFALIVIYVLFFITSAQVSQSARVWILVMATLAILTGILDFGEDFAILNAIAGGGAAPRVFGLPKWIFYFLTCGAESAVAFGYAGRTSWAYLFGSLLLLAAILGTTAAALGGLNGIQLATLIGIAGMLGLAILPVVRS